MLEIHVHLEESFFLYVSYAFTSLPDHYSNSTLENCEHLADLKVPGVIRASGHTAIWKPRARVLGTQSLHVNLTLTPGSALFCGPKTDGQLEVNEDEGQLSIRFGTTEGADPGVEVESAESLSLALDKNSLDLGNEERFIRSVTGMIYVRLYFALVPTVCLIFKL